MIATIVIALVTFISITLSLILFPQIKIGKVKIDVYWIIALVGAVVLLATSLAPIKEVGNQLISNTSINPLKILVLFFSMTLISIFLDELGLFRFLARRAAQRAKGSQFVLFFVLYGLTALLTVFTSNDIVILTLTPFICVFCKNSKINPIPYLIAEFAAANTWSLMFVIGNPTNIYLATSAGINFIEYFKVMAIPTLCAGVIELGILFLLFFRKLKEPLTASDVEARVEDKPALIVGVIHLLICLIFLIISSYLNLEMWLISAICAGSLLLFMLIYSIFKKANWVVVGGSLKRLPYPLIPFFLSMFVIVVALNSQGITSTIASWFGNQNTIWIYGYTSFLTCNLINNIPMSILYSTLCQSLETTNYLAGIYASIVGSNIGAFLTPLGALAGIMFVGLVNKYEIKFRFIDFIKYGVVIAIPTISIALLMLFVFIK